MKFKLSADEYASIYVFVGGLSQVPIINRENRKRLAKLANKFAPGATEITLNQQGLLTLIAILTNAVDSGKKAMVKEGITVEQINDITKTNTTFEKILDKLNKKLLNEANTGTPGLGMVLGKPEVSKLGEKESKDAK